MPDSMKRASLIFVALVILVALVAGPMAIAETGPRAGEYHIRIPFIEGGPPIGQLALQFRSFANGLRDVTGIKHAGDERLFVAQRDGRIFIVEPDGAVQDEPFLDIRDRVKDKFWEQGLLGLAFPADYGDSGVFYVSYAADPGAPINAPLVLSRFTTDPVADGPVDTDTEQVLLTIPHSEDFHYGGDLQFGPDSYLYMSTGDSGFLGTAGEIPNALNGANLLGKILRLDVDPIHGDSFTVPPDNPFVGNPGFRNEIWHYGLRNPWRISFDPWTGDLFVADVGLGRQEEVNRIAAGVSGLSLGWPCYEGTDPRPSWDVCSTITQHTPPIYSYSHGVDHCSIIGGYTYYGTAMPAFRGRYLFADLCSGTVWALSGRVAAEVQVFEAGRRADGAWTTFGVDRDGELYLGQYQGAETVFRLANDG